MNRYILPKHFEWVYVYIGKKSNEIGYIGRAKNAERCARRIIEHRNDHWYPSQEWKVAWYPCLNRFESETLEAILINRYNPKWNKDKVGWGLPAYDPDPGSCLSANIENMRTNPEKLITCSNATLAMTRFEERLMEILANDGWKRTEEAYYAK